MPQPSNCREYQLAKWALYFCLAVRTSVFDSAAHHLQVAPGRLACASSLPIVADLSIQKLIRVAGKLALTVTVIPVQVIRISLKQRHARAAIEHSHTASPALALSSMDLGESLSNSSNVSH